MCSAQHRRDLLVLLEAIAITAGFFGHGYAQTPSTGALTGVVLDPSGAAVPAAAVTLVNQDIRETVSATSDERGRFSFLLLTPGRYQLCASKTDFAEVCSPGINISVTETRRLDLRLPLATVVNQLKVAADTPMVQRDNSALGRVVNKTAVGGLPLVTRNFAQIASLSPGVIAGVSNAGELGIGGTALSQINKSNDGIFVHGSRSYDNNWQLDGISVSDVHGNGSGSGGIPIPNPDTIQEFKEIRTRLDTALGTGQL